MRGKAIFFHFLVVASMTGLLFQVVPPLELVWYRDLQKSIDSNKFSLTLRFYKGALAFLVVLIGPWALETKIRWLGSLSKLKSTLLLGAMLSCSILIGPAITVGFVKFDSTLPPVIIPWMLNNLILVCFAEEVLFRAYLQDSLEKFFPEGRKWIAVVFVSLIFGMAHYQGGFAFILLSSLAGGVYGWAFLRSGLLASVGVHFFVNATHFFLFSYPALNRS